MLCKVLYLGTRSGAIFCSVYDCPRCPGHPAVALGAQWQAEEHGNHPAFFGWRHGPTGLACHVDLALDHTWC